MGRSKSSVNSAVLDLADGCRGVIYVGLGGSGSLTIADGGYIRSRYGYVAASQYSSGNVTVKGNGTTWFLYDLYNDPDCLGAALYIGSTAGSDSGGTATVTVKDGAFISVHNLDPNAPYATKVGASGTLTGNGVLDMFGSGEGSIKAIVLGTLAPGKPQLTIDGNLELLSGSTTICHVNPQATPQNDQVLVSNLSGGGTMRLGGTLTVVGSGTFAGGMSFILLQTEGLRVGTFANFHFYSFSPVGNCLKPTLQYTDQAVNLLIVNTCLSSEGAYDDL